MLVFDYLSDWLTKLLLSQTLVCWNSHCLKETFIFVELCRIAKHKSLSTIMYTELNQKVHVKYMSTTRHHKQIEQCKLIRLQLRNNT